MLGSGLPPLQRDFICTYILTSSVKTPFPNEVRFWEVGLPHSLSGDTDQPVTAKCTLETGAPCPHSAARWLGDSFCSDGPGCGTSCGTSSYHSCPPLSFSVLHWVQQRRDLEKWEGKERDRL